MRTKYLLVLMLSLLMAGTQAFAQKCKADRLYNAFNYTKAIPYYEKLASKNNKHAAYAMHRLGDSYRLTGNFEEAARWYSNAIAIDTTCPDVYFNYGQSLRSIGKYEEAAAIFRKYAQLKPGDPRGKLFAQYSLEVNKWEEPEFDYELLNAESLNTPYADFSPVYGKDGVIFTSDRMARAGAKRYGWTGAYYLDLFSAPLKKEAGNEFPTPGSPSLYAASLSQPYHDGPASFSSDFNTIYFTRVTRKSGQLDSTRYYTNKLKIYSSKNEGGNKWSNPEPFYLNSEAYSVGHPALTKDGKTLYFVSDMPGGHGGTDIYRVKQTDNGWGPAENLGETINTFGNEMFPYIHEDKVLYFSSDGLPGLGSLDVFKSTIGEGTFSKPVNLNAPVNSPADDFGIVINANGKEGMISSNRAGGKGEDDIYLITIKERLPDSVLIAGYVKDKASLEVLANSTVFAYNLKTNEVLVLKTDEKGYYEMWAKPGTSYSIKGMKNGFSADCLNLAIEPKTKVTALDNRDLLLGKYAVDQIFRLENIYYDFDKWNIRSDAAVELDKVVAFLNDNPDITVELGSHTDSRGSFKYNERLSDRRATSAVEYIIKTGISNKRITAKGYGETQLVNRCSDGVQCTDQEHQDNRRTEVKITGMAKPDDLKAQQPLDVYKKGQTLTIKDFKPDFFDACGDQIKAL